MPFNFTQPALVLSPFVKQYWALDNVMPREKTIPSELFQRVS